MKNKKLVAGLVTVTLVAVLGVGATLAYFTDKEDATNVITMGHVDIELTEPNFDKKTNPDGTENPNFDGKEDNKISKVIPGQTIVKDPTITVADDSENAYLRVKLAFTSNGLAPEKLAEVEKLLVLKEGWNKGTDGYYYYNKEVKAKDQLVVFEEVKIPTTWGNDEADKTFNIVVNAEAIQAKNFTPVKTGENITSWGKVTVEEYGSKPQA